MATSEDVPEDTCTPLPLGGYDQQFVESPPKQWECPICLLTLRGPHLLSCCGVKICQTCIEGVKEKSKPCPKCRQTNFFSLLDKELERQIFDLLVYCPNSGCDWKGELRALEKHLSPSLEGECLYVEIECSHGCGHKGTRGDMKNHEKKSCSQLPLEVQIKVLQDITSELSRKYQTEISELKTKLEEQAQEITQLKTTLANSVSKSEACCTTYVALKKSALELMPKLKGGAIPGVHYYASKGRVEIYGCTDEEVQARAYRFQLEYQQVILSMRIRHILLLPYTNKEELGSFLTELNQRYDSIYLFETLHEGDSAVKIISLSPSQLEPAIKAVTDKLKHLQVIKMTLKSGRKLWLKMGDIIKEDVDVIVSPANRALKQGEGAVSRALNTATNGELQKLADKYISDFGHLQTGNVAVTHSGGGTLKCKYIVHLAGPKASHNLSASGNASDLLYNGISKVLSESIKLHVSSIAIPAVGSGSFLIKNDIVAPAILNAVTKFDFGESKALKDIRIVIHNPPVYREFAEHLQKIKTNYN